MSNNGGYGYGNDYSYGYDYSSQNQNPNQGYEYNGNGSNFNQASYTSPYSQTSSNKQQSGQPAYDPAALLSNPAAQIGMQFGTQAISAGQEYVNSNVN